jgi:hypothetical protein
MTKKEGRERGEREEMRQRENIASFCGICALLLRIELPFHFVRWWRKRGRIEREEEREGKEAVEREGGEGREEDMENKKVRV